MSKYVLSLESHSFNYAPTNVPSIKQTPPIGALTVKVTFWE